MKTNVLVTHAHTNVATVTKQQNKPVLVLAVILNCTFVNNPSMLCVEDAAALVAFAAAGVGLVGISEKEPECVKALICF